MRSRRSLRLPSALRGIASIVTGSVAGQGLVLLAYPLLSRLYDPAEFGLLAVFSAVVSMVSKFSTASLESAIPIPVGHRDAAAVAWAGLLWVTVTSVLTGCVGVIAAAELAELLGVPRLAEFWWLLALTVLILGAYMVLSEWMVRERSYGALARRNLLQGVGQVGSQVGLGLAGIRPLGLLLGLGVGRLLAMGGLVSRGGLLRQPLPSFGSVAAAIRRYRRFPQLAMPSDLVNSAGLEVPVLLVAALYGDATAGLLGLTIRVVGGPSGIIGQAVYQVFTGESSKAIREPTGTLGSSVRNSVVRLIAVGAVPAAILVGFGPPLFGVVFGERWVEAGQYAQVLMFAYLAQFAVTPVSSTLFLLERQAQELGWATVRLLLTASGPLVCGLVGAPIMTAIIAMTVGHVISYAMLFLLCVRAADASDRAHRGQLG